MSICAEWRLWAAASLWRRAVSYLWAGCAGGSASGCFDVPQVAVERAPEALDIDNFEDGDGEPNSELFTTWHCATTPGLPRVSCGPLAPGFASGMAEVVRFQLEDPDNGSIEYASLVLEAPVRLGSIDLGAYERLAFAAKLEPSAEARFVGLAGSTAPHSTPLSVQLACDAVGGGSWMEYGLQVGPAWSAFSVALTDIVRPSWVADFSWRDCIANVESLSFVGGPSLSDGEAFAGTFSIDEISLH